MKIPVLFVTALLFLPAGSRVSVTPPTVAEPGREPASGASAVASTVPRRLPAASRSRPSASKRPTHSPPAKAPRGPKTGRPARADGNVEAIVRDAARRAGISGDGLVALCRCESGLRPWARSACCSGLTQQHRELWAARAARYGHRGASVYDAEANADVGARMIAAGGLAHWAPRCQRAYRKAAT